MLSVANVSVKIFFCPELAFSIENYISFVCRERLYRVHYIRQTVFRGRAEENMCVIWHYHPRYQLVSGAIPLAYIAPAIAPALVPDIMPAFIPSSSIAFKKPACANPLAPPPLSAMPTL